jgi:hypothetical protein
MEQRKHWWNSRWGRLARRDVYLREDGGTWHVEDRVGGAEGRSRWFEYPDEDLALERVRALLATGDGWRELQTRRPSG